MDVPETTSRKSWLSRRRLLGGLTGLTAAGMTRQYSSGQPSTPEPTGTPANCPALEQRKIYIVSSAKLDMDQKSLETGADVLNTQVQRDFAPFWGVNVEIVSSVPGQRVPTDAWRVQVWNACGNNLYTDNGHSWWTPNANVFRPHGWVLYDGTDSWIHAASHECMEMLANPFLERFQRAPAPTPMTGEVLYNVEVCDPCSIADPSYRIHDKVVSDFVLPSYYDASLSESGGAKFNHLGTIQAPLRPVLGAYQNFASLDLKDWTRTTWSSVGFYSESIAAAVNSANGVGGTGAPSATPNPDCLF